MTPAPHSPFLSIVVPVLDEAPGIAAALAPLQALRAAGVELLVVDGGSGDDTVFRAAPLCDRVFVAPRGRGRQMHEGARAARGRVLLFLHADTALPPGAVESIRRAVEGGAAWGRFDVSIEGSSPWLRVVAFAMNLRSRLTGIATGDQAIFATRAAYDAAGGLPDLPLMEDIAFSTTLRCRSRPACLRQRVLTSGRRWEKHGIVATVLGMWTLRLRYFLGADPRKLAIAYGYRPREDALPSGPAGLAARPEVASEASRPRGNAPEPVGVRIAILAKAPLPGFAKTRLIPRLGADGAAALQRWLLHRTLVTAHAAKLGPVVLWCAPDAADPEFAALKNRWPGLELRTQPEADLGERMRAAAAEAPERPTLVLGTDCPWLEPDDLIEAASRLAAGRDAVLVPADDGGYVLIGVAAPHAAAFGRLPWGSDAVLARTRDALAHAGQAWAELPTRPDVDRPADLDRLFADFPEAAAAVGLDALRSGMHATTSKKNGSTPPGGRGES